MLEAHIALKIPTLDKKIAARTSLIGKLEHAINIEEIKGNSPTHVTASLKENRIDSIDAWTSRLRKENQEIREAITAIEFMHDPMSFRKDLEDGGGSIAYRKNTGGYSLFSAQSSLSGPGYSVDNSMPHDGLTIQAYDKITHSGRNGKDKVASTMKSSIRATSALAGSALKLLAGRGDGEPREAGFVTFTKLSSTQACLQMIHHPSKFNDFPHTLSSVHHSNNPFQIQFRLRWKWLKHQIPMTFSGRTSERATSLYNLGNSLV